MAKVYARSIMPEHEFRSRGLMVYEGMPMSINAGHALDFYNIEHGEHISRQLTSDDIEWADLILTMSGNHKRAVEEIAGDKVFTLKEYCLEKGGDIADPFGGDEDTYIRCFDEIKECILILKEKLK